MSKTQSYRDLEIYQLALELVIETHMMSLANLPRFEMYEEGSQIRRSSKSIVSNIVEGYGRRCYKQDFIKFIINALASNIETIDHLETLYETESFKDEKLYKNILERLETLGKKLSRFLDAVRKHHNDFT